MNGEKTYWEYAIYTGSYPLDRTIELLSEKVREQVGKMAADHIAIRVRIDVARTMRDFGI